MLVVKSYVAPSKIHGLGLFADEPISRGTVVWRFDSEWDRVYHRDIVDLLPEPARNHLLTYGYFDGDEIVLCADNGKYFNHSQDPNVEASSGRGCDVALRDIQPGEELTADYRRFDFRENLFARSCSCR